MKKMCNVFMVIVFLMAIMAGPAMAGWCDTTNNYVTNEGGKGGKGGDGGDATAVAFGINAQKQGQKQQQGQIAFGGDSKVVNSGNSAIIGSGNSKIEEGAVQNYNTDVNVNKVDNTDVNVNKVVAGNLNGNNNGNFEQTLTFEDKRDHISGPGMMNTDSKLADGKAFAAKTMVSVWAKVNGLTKSQAKKIWSGASDSDIEVKEMLLFENKFSTSRINKGASGDYMGAIVLSPDGNDVSKAGMEAKAALIAMENGATHMSIVYQGTGRYAGGDSWGVGIGGGASIMTDGDDVAIAPTGGLGIGGADAFNELLPDMVVELYFNEANLKPTKSQAKTFGLEVGSEG